MTLPVPFDAVLFDLDGTLVATDRFWPDAARAGARRAFAELGLARRLPSQAQWMDLVGRPIQAGFDLLFADLAPDQRAHVMQRCVEAEHALLQEGRAGLLPGVADTLAALRAAGVHTGVASNCGRDYLTAMMKGLGLARWIEQARCLDSRGVTDKADMIEDLLATFGTRRALMVGDRAGDRDAAWANGLPHVHLARGYAAAGETVEAEATIEGMDDLLPRLAARRAWTDELARAFAPRPGAPLGISGGPGAGKTLLAEELAPLCGARVSTRARPAPDPGLSWIVEGDFLWEPDLRAGLGALLMLDAPRAVLERRLVGRDVRPGGVDAMAGVRRRLAEFGASIAAHPPGPACDRWIDASNVLDPLIPGRTGT